MSCLYLANYWVTKRSQRMDGSWAIFVWGLEATSMADALEKVSGKPVWKFNFHFKSETKWESQDVDSFAWYTIQKQDKVPKFPKKWNVVIRDQTNHKPKTKIKPMPVPGSLFS